MIKQVGLEITEAEQLLLEAGKLVRTNGVLRNAETMEIFKHLKIVDLDAESCWQELGKAISRAVKENKKGMMIAGVVVVVSASAAGIHFYRKRKAAKDLEEKCNAWLNKAIYNYIQSASAGSLNIDCINACEDALMSLPHITDKVFISMTQEQILEFTTNLREYTCKLAEANDYEIDELASLDYGGNVITCLLNNLGVQREVLLSVA